MCATHGERINHFYCYHHNVLCCRVCTEELHTSRTNCVIVDCYELRPEEIKEILLKIESANLDHASGHNAKGQHNVSV